MAPTDPKTPRILVIRGGAIGDFLLTLPAIKLLRENFPKAQIEILGYKHIIALAEGRFYSHASRSIEYAPLSRFFIPNADLDLELVEYFAGFQQVISYLYDPDRFFENNLRRCGVKNLICASVRVDDSTHAAYQLAQPLQSLALFLDDPAATLHPSDADRAAAQAFIGDASVPLIALHPGSGSPRKNWPVRSWVDLGRWLGTTCPDATIVLVGGEADHGRLEECRAAWSKQRLLVAQDLALPTLAGVLERCSFFIGHDSGISHIAAATGTPGILLFGPTDEAVWGPANPGIKIVRTKTGEMDSISVAQVQAAVEPLLP